MNDKACYRIDWSQLQDDQSMEGMNLQIEQGMLVPVEDAMSRAEWEATIDIATIEEGDTCSVEGLTKAGTRHCTRPPGHDGMHMGIIYWGAAVGEETP